MRRADRWVRRVLRICSKAGARRYETINIIHVPSLQTLDVDVARRFRTGRPLVAETLGHGVADVGALYFDMQTSLPFQSRVGDVIKVVWRLRDTQPPPAFPGIMVGWPPPRRFRGERCGISRPPKAIPCRCVHQ